MLPNIPEGVLDFVRSAFASANSRATNTLARQPSMHEEGLDFQLIAALDEVGSRIMPGSGAAVEIETHWLGGRRHFDFMDHRRWKIADIAVLVAVRKLGVLVARKVALLQSKRLYSDEVPVHELEFADFRFGIGRLFDRTAPIVTLTNPRAFEFTEQSEYGALSAGSDQTVRIDAYEASRGIPIYYNFYNSPTMPYRGFVPARALQVLAAGPELGCRVMRASDVHPALKKLAQGATPSFSQLAVTQPPGLQGWNNDHGWRIENFVADEMLRRREGQLFEDAQDSVLSALLYDRPAPTAAGILVTIDLAGED